MDALAGAGAPGLVLISIEGMYGDVLVCISIIRRAPLSNLIRRKMN
jgi:hypothetical protein